MSLTFTEARQRVTEDYASHWPDGWGTFYVDPTGYEDDEAFQVVVGARETLVDNDPDFAVIDAPAVLVLKDTGEIVEVPVLENMERLDAMREVRDDTAGL